MLVVLAGCGSVMQPVDAGPELFLPEHQSPVFEKGLVLAYDSLPCTPIGGVPQNDCNHHGSSVAELGDSTIAIAWFHGVAEKSLDSRIVWAKRAPGAQIFSTPEVLYDDPTRSEGNSVLWREKGTLWLFFVNIEGNGWAQARMRFMRSIDDGATWTPPVTLSDSDCWMLRYPPVRAPSGNLVLPGYYECLAVPTFVRSSNDFSTWSLVETWKDGTFLLDHVGSIQPSMIVTTDGGLAAVMRDGTSRQRLQRMESGDEGRTWTKNVSTGLPNPGAATAQTRLKDGHVVVVFDNAPNARAPLSAALSTDDGRHFVAVRDLVIDDCATDECSYPYVVQSERDGTIWVAYTHNRRTIGWVHFNEAWLAQGGGEARVWCQADEACVGSRCFPACGGDAGVTCTGGASCVSGACRVSCTAGCATGETCDADGYCRPSVTHACGW